MPDQIVRLELGGQGGTLHVVDTATGKTHTCKVTSQQAAAVMHLIIDSDQSENELQTELYITIGNLFEGWPNSARPIP